jgi:hypothetical protein
VFEQMACHGAHLHGTVLGKRHSGIIKGQDLRDFSGEA